MSDHSNTPIPPNDSTAGPEHSATPETQTAARRPWFALVACGLVLIALAGYLISDYLHAQALVSISDTRAVSPDNGTIILVYRYPVLKPQFSPERASIVDLAGNHVNAQFSSSLDETKTIETIRLARPTPFNRSLSLQRNDAAKNSHIVYRLGLKPIPQSIQFSTTYEQTELKGLLPASPDRYALERSTTSILKSLAKPA